MYAAYAERQALVMCALRLRLLKVLQSNWSNSLHLTRIYMFILIPIKLRPHTETQPPPHPFQLCPLQYENPITSKFKELKSADDFVHIAGVYILWICCFACEIERKLFNGFLPHVTLVAYQCNLKGFMQISI